MPTIDCRLKAINEEGTYKIELVDMGENGGLFKTIKDKDIDGAISRAMSKVFALFGVKVFWIRYCPKSNYYHWILGNGQVVYKPIELRKNGLTSYRQMILRDFLKAQAFIAQTRR